MEEKMNEKQVARILSEQVRWLIQEDLNPEIPSLHRQMDASL